MDDGKATRTPEARPKLSLSSLGWSGAKTVVRIVVGVLLMIVGLAALFTPLTPGSWLILVGLEVLGLRILLRKKLCVWAAARPDSRFRRTTCRVLRVDAFDTLKRRWQRRKGASTEDEVPLQEARPCPTSHAETQDQPKQHL